MPNVFVFTSEEDAKVLLPYLDKDGMLALALRKATAETFSDLAGPQDVEVRLIASEASDNTTRVQIYTVASMTEGRRPQAGVLRRTWARKLSQAWEESIKKVRQLAVDFPLSEVGVWPTMPEGEWYLASKAIQDPMWD